MSIRRSGSTSVSAADEAYRILRSSVKFADAEAPLRSILVVDVDRAASSDVADQLALAFARGGDRCVRVLTRDAAGEGPGLSELLAGTTDVSQAQQPGDAPNLALVSAGTDLNPDVLASERLSGALSALLAANDVAIISCASLPAHGDALAIAPRVDATLLVITSGHTRRPRAIEARDALQRVGANLLGVVLVETKRRWFW